MKKYIITTFVVLLSLTSYAQVGIGTTTPNAGAALHIDGDKKSLLLPRMDTANRPADPVAGLMIFNTEKNCVEYYDGIEWYDMCDPCNGQTSVTFDYKGASVTYNTVVFENKCWLDRNLGALRVAQSKDDFQAFGDLYQWGRSPDGHQHITWTSTTTTDGSEVGTTTTLYSVPQPTPPALWVENTVPNGTWYDGTSPTAGQLWLYTGLGINNPCPSGFKVPRIDEWELVADEINAANPTSAVAEAASMVLKLPHVPLRTNVGGFQRLETPNETRYYANLSAEVGRAIRGIETGYFERYGYPRMDINDNDGALAVGRSGTMALIGYPVRCIKR